MPSRRPQPWRCSASSGGRRSRWRSRSRGSHLVPGPPSWRRSGWGAGLDPAPPRRCLSPRAAAPRASSLSATTFVGDIPFVQQLRYFDSLTSSAPAATRFVQGAREATLASYLQDVGTQVILPYLNDAVVNKQ